MRTNTNQHTIGEVRMWCSMPPKCIEQWNGCGRSVLDITRRTYEMCLVGLEENNTQPMQRHTKRSLGKITKTKRNLTMDERNTILQSLVLHHADIPMPHGVLA